MKFDNSTQWTGWQATQKVEIPPGVTVERKVPLRAPSVHSDVWVPFLLSLASGFFVFVVIGIFCLALRLAFVASLAIGGLTAAGIWFALVALWPKTLWATETITAPELAPPALPIARTHYELLPGDGSNTTRIGEIELEPELVIAWCRAACAGQSLAFSVWEPRFALPNGKKGRERYHAFREHLIKQGFAEEAGGNIGLRICWQDRDARRFVRGFAEQNGAKATPLLDVVRECAPACGDGE